MAEKEVFDKKRIFSFLILPLRFAENPTEINTCVACISHDPNFVARKKREKFNMG